MGEDVKTLARKHMRIMAYRIHGMRCPARNAVTACLRSVARAASMGGLSRGLRRRAVELGERFPQAVQVDRAERAVVEAVARACPSRPR